MWLRMSVIFTLILAFIAVSYSRKEISSPCCSQLLQYDEPNAIVQCVNSSVSETIVESVIGPTLTVVIVTRATPDIHAYAAYSFLLQQEYSRTNGYQLLPLTQDSDTTDYRYHRKIVPLLEAMERNPFADYYVWMDADLVMLDFKLRLEGIASQHPQAHILMSRDVSNLANTGCIIVRNSRWSRDFLSEWLALRTNPHILNEQIGFDHLYQQYKLRDKEQGTSHLNKIALLPHETLNSIFPAMREQLPNHKVLHMATDGTAYRQAVFRTAAVNYCTALRDDTPVPHQLGISRSFLQTTVVTINKAEYKRIERIIGGLQPHEDAYSGIDDLLKQYRDSVSKYCYAVSYQNNNKETRGTLALRKQSFLTVQKVVDDRLKYVVKDYMDWNNIGTAEAVVEVGVMGMNSADKTLYSAVLNNKLPHALRDFLDHVENVKKEKLKIGASQLADLNETTITAELIPDLLKAGVELAFELVQSIAKMGDDYPSFGYTPNMIREEQIYLLEYILHGLDVMLILVHPKMVPSVEAMKNDFLVKCGAYCKNR